MGHTDRVWRRVAYIRELADLGMSGPEIAGMLRLPRSTVSQLAGLHSISLTKNRRESLTRRTVRAGYAAGRPPADIAEELGTSVSSVRAIACHLGLTRNATRDPWKHLRGFEIPADRRAEYNHLVCKVRCTPREAGYELGLLERPKP